MTDFRDRVVGVASKGLQMMEDYFEGKVADEKKIDRAVRMTGFGVKVEHMNQIKTQVERSQAIRLIPFIPKEQRERYIAQTNPEAKPYLLPRPKKGK